jgi:hypothetical protein
MDHEIRVHGLSSFAVCYVDDIIIFSNTPEEHMEHLGKLFEMCTKVGLRIHPSKCVFAADSVEFLGHNVSRLGTSPNKAKTSAIRNMPAPANVPALRLALGLFNYYRCYVPNSSAIAQPLNELLGSKTQWRWVRSHDEAYQELKDLMCKEGLAVRKADFSKPFLLDTDFSNYECGAVLGQVDDSGQEYMVACASRSLNDHNKHYCSFQGEMLAAVWAVRLFRYYLQSAQFTLLTDHKPLTWLMGREDLAGQHASGP